MYVGLPHVLDLADHLVNFFGWVSQGDHSGSLLLLTLFYQSTPSCLKVRGWVGAGGGGPDRTGKCKTNKSNFFAGWIKGIILGTQLLSF